MSSLIKPFKALHYNPRLIKNLSQVTCPPYDIIKKSERSYFKKLSPYNFSHITLSSSKDSYKRIAKTFSSWIQKGILTEDARDSFYLYEQTFTLEGKRMRRVGVLGLLQLDRRGVIFPHEYTHAAPKKDRAKILKEVKANLSPIFVVSPYTSGVLQQISAHQRRRKPFMDFKDRQGIGNRLWKIDDKKTITRIVKEFDNRKMIIADGHHRFEVAHVYFRKHKKAYRDLNYIFAYFTDMHSGICILPTHRIIRTETKGMLKALARFFKVTPISRGQLEGRLKDSKIFSFGIYLKGIFYFLQLKDKAILGKIGTSRKKRLYRELDVYVLHHFVFNLLQLDIRDIDYTHTTKGLRGLGRDTVVFILREPHLASVCKIARAGHKLPQKSTYFYPKVLSGLLVRRFKR